MKLNDTKQNSIKTNLNNRILHGLSLEWDAALLQLRYTHSITLTKPLFSIKDIQRKLAFWDSEKREICFSSTFVYDHSWDDIKDVLLHEIAHQLTSEYFKTNNESPHGKSFHEACHLLRANPKASGSYLPLSERVLNPDVDENDKIMFKIQKLLALAKSNHIYEAEAAVAKAHELIEKYNIDMINNNTERNYISMHIGRPSLRHFREEYALANLITEHYFVYGIWVSTYVIEKGKMGRVLEISGTTQNVKIAAYVYDFVINHINMAWKDYNKTNNFNRYRKTDFATGIIEGLQSKLKLNSCSQTEMQNPSEKRLPVKIEDNMLKAYTSYRYPNIRSFKRSASSVDENLLRDGKKIGKKLVISKGIEKHKSGNQKYLQ